MPIKRRGLILDKKLEGPQDSNGRVAYDGENYYKTQRAAPLVLSRGFSLPRPHVCQFFHFSRNYLDFSDFDFEKPKSKSATPS